MLKDGDKWYTGISAGSYIACPSIEMHGWKPEKNTYGLTDVTAMNLVPFLVSVHYNREKYRENVAEHIPGAGYPVRILTDDQAFYVRDGNVRLLGKQPEILANDIMRVQSNKNSAS